MLAYAASQPSGSVEACVAKPALVTSNSTILRSVWGAGLRWTSVAPHISVEELAAAMLHQVQVGFEKEPLLNDDLKKIGSEVLAKEAESSCDMPPQNA